MPSTLRISKNVFGAVMVIGALAMAGTVASAAQPQIPQAKVSDANRVNLGEAKEALDAKRYSEAVAKSNAALATAGRTKDDTFAAHAFLFKVAEAQNDLPGMMKALEGQIESGFLPPAGVNLAYRNLVGLAYQQKDYRSAIGYGQQLIKNGDTSADVYQWVGQGYYELKEYGNAVKFFNDMVTDKEKRGQKPARNELIQLQSSYDKAGNKEQAQATLEKVVRYYPDADTWAALLFDVRKERQDQRQKLHLFRLMQLTGNLKQGPDYMAYSDAAMSQGLHAESQKVLEGGIKAKVFPVGAEQARAERYIKSAATHAEEIRVGLARQEAAAKAAPTGEPYIALGMAYLSFAQYDKAIAALQAGIAKGGLKFPADARITLGVAQLRGGQKAEAQKTFRAVKAEDDVTRRLAQLWALYAS